MPKRGTITTFIDQHEVPWEVGMGVLTAVYVVLAFMEDELIPGFNGQTVAVVAVASVFLIEFRPRSRLYQPAMARAAETATPRTVDRLSKLSVGSDRADPPARAGIQTLIAVPVPCAEPISTLPPQA